MTVCYVGGIALGRWWLEEPAGAMLLAVLLLPVAAGLVSRRLAGAFAAVLLLAAAAAGAAAFVLASAPPTGGLLEYAGPYVYVEGTVLEEPLRGEGHTAYRVRADRVETPEGRRPVTGDLLVKVYGAPGEPFWVGERVRLRGVIVEPRGRRNPGEFDYRFYLRTRGITAAMHLKPYQAVSLGPGEAGGLSAVAAGLRARMAEGIAGGLPSPAAELLTAVLFGQRHRLPAGVEENFRRAGAGHLMAVSGLHVGLVAALILGLWRRLGLRGQWPLAAAILLICGYAFLTGMRPSALRAAVMLSFALGALLLDRERDLPTALAAAALITLAGNPLLLFTAGFQMSYAATLAIVYGAPPLADLLSRLRLPAFLRFPAAATVAAQAGVLPLTALHFQHIPILAIFFNLLILPATALLLGLGLAGALLCLLPAPSLAQLFFWACRPLLEYLLAITALSSLPGAYRAVFPPRPVELFLWGALYAALLLLYHNRGTRLAVAGALHALPALPARLRRRRRRRLKLRPASLCIAFLVLCTAAVWAGPLLAPPARLTVTCLDVGQGAAALVETPCGLKILVDSGGELPFRGDPGQIGETVLLPFLRHRRVRSLDLALITHPHEDHFGGMLPLLDSVPVRRMIISPVPGRSSQYTALLDSAAALGIPVEEAFAGYTWEGRCGLKLEILHPAEAALPRLNPGGGGNLNDASVVLLLTYGEVRFLFTGDIEEAAARELLRASPDALGAEVLLVPHHGGPLPVAGDFFAAVSPRVAVVPVGPNVFGHPHPGTLQALDGTGARVLRSDLHGAVILRTDGTRLFVRTML